MYPPPNFNHIQILCNLYKKSIRSCYKLKTPAPLPYLILPFPLEKNCSPEFGIFIIFMTIFKLLLYMRASLVAQRQIICLPMQEMRVRTLGQKDSPEKKMATHSSIPFFFFSSLFNWRIITLQYNDGFCHTSIWIGQNIHVSPPSWTPFLPPYPPCPCHRAPALGANEGHRVCHYSTTQPILINAKYIQILTLIWSNCRISGSYFSTLSPTLAVVKTLF